VKCSRKLHELIETEIAREVFYFFPVLFFIETFFISQWLLASGVGDKNILVDVRLLD
jgi:hypothetical protein